MGRRLLLIITITIAVVFNSIAGITQSLRNSQEIKNLHLLRNYKSLTNSLVLGQEQIFGYVSELKAGSRNTILNTKGQGSLRHIFVNINEKMAEDFDIEIYVDGEQKPGIKGTLPEIIRAVQQTKQSFVSNAGLADNNKFNIYLPVPFDKSIRVELVIKKDVSSYVPIQVDYRLEDNSLEGAKLTQKGDGKDIQLFYTGLKSLKQAEHTSTIMQVEKFDFKGDRVIKLFGPGIIRKFTITGVKLGNQMKIKFDEEKTAAVNVDLSDFFENYQGELLSKTFSAFPMPFNKIAEVQITGFNENDNWQIELEIERVDNFGQNWAYFHAKSYKTSLASGFTPHTALYLKGNGHFVGLIVPEFSTNTNFGSYDIIDGETSAPVYIRNINEIRDSNNASPAFANGQPYYEYNFKLENPDVFKKSIFVSIDAQEKTSPRTIAVWYQDTPKDTSADAVNDFEWSVFGPVSLKSLGELNNPENLFELLPKENILDSEQNVEITYGTQKGVYRGWAVQKSIGSHLNLSYIQRHLIDETNNYVPASIPGLVMAKTILNSSKKQTVQLLVSYDDAIEIYVNDKKILADYTTKDGFFAKKISVDLRTGSNKIIVKSLNSSNTNDYWAGFSISVFDKMGKEITKDLIGK